MGSQPISRKKAALAHIPRVPFDAAGAFNLQILVSDA
jgi:hypothetical protein